VRGPERGEVPVLNTFTADAAAGLPGPEWLRRRRAEAFEDFASMPLPSEKEEVWRYSPIDRLDLGAYRPLSPSGAGVGGSGDDPVLGAFVAGVVADVGPHSALVVVRDGRPVTIETAGLPAGVRIAGLAGGEGAASPLGAVLTGGDALVRLNDAFLPDALVIEVGPGVVVEGPILVVQWCTGDASGNGDDDGRGPAVFPRTLVRAGRGSQVQVVEMLAGAADGRPALVVPVTELAADDGANLSYMSTQVLGSAAWHIARTGAVVERDATLRTFTVGLGGAYDRTRLDAANVGLGAHSELRSAYLGSGDQVHDIRTMQDHRAPKTTSDLLCKGAVAGSSRSVYSGLIRVRHGAVRTDAMQTNHNLVLDERAHADSVPNLDIEENDVKCSHASTVGPIDEDQRYYVESRGVPPERAERLIVLGFFNDIVDRSPVPGAVERLRRDVGVRLAGAVGAGTGTGDGGG
jgi:Fe-S cluster assembly protein SufD